MDEHKEFMYNVDAERELLLDDLRYIHSHLEHKYDSDSEEHIRRYNSRVNAFRKWQLQNVDKMYQIIETHSGYAYFIECASFNNELTEVYHNISSILYKTRAKAIREAKLNVKQNIDSEYHMLTFDRPDYKRKVENVVRFHKYAQSDFNRSLRKLHEHQSELDKYFILDSIGMDKWYWLDESGKKRGPHDTYELALADALANEFSSKKPKKKIAKNA